MTNLEIRDLAGRLLRDKTLGWCDNPRLLAQYLGFHDEKMLARRIDGSILLTRYEQEAASESLEKILAGEVICEHRMFQGSIFGLVKVALDPRPLGWNEKTRCSISVTAQGIKLSIINKPAPAQRRGMPTLRSLLCQS